MNIVKRVAAVLLAALLLAVTLLGGCSAYRNYAVEIPQAGPRSIPGESIFGPDVPADSEEDWLRRWQQPESTLTEAQRSYGSAGLVGWPSALVSIYLNEKDGAQWDEDMIARSRANLAVAVDWMEQQAAQYGADTTIYYDDGSEDNGLCRTDTYDGKFVIDEDADESDEFYHTIETICAELDTDALHRKYNTSSIGFLVFLPVEGCSFTMVHYLEDGDDYYHEYSCLYAYDIYSDPDTFDCPSVYAHEILHQFGAPDLYEDGTDYYVTPELTEYVTETWPDAIMYDTYEPDGSLVYDRVNKSISPLTAYRLGLCDTFIGVSRFPDATESPPGTFLTEKPKQPGSMWETLPDEVAAA